MCVAYFVFHQSLIIRPFQDSCWLITSQPSREVYMRMCARNRLHRRYCRCLSTNWGATKWRNGEWDAFYKDPQYDHREEQTPNGTEEESSIGRDQKINTMQWDSSTRWRNRTYNCGEKLKALLRSRSPGHIGTFELSSLIEARQNCVGERKV
jgi:hypothetical protein